MSSSLRVACFLVLAMTVLGLVWGEVITVTNGERQGTWGTLQRCPEGSLAVGYATMNDFTNLPVFDDTALNSIALYCNDAAQTNITSSLGYVGSFGRSATCLLGSHLESFRLLVDPIGTHGNETYDETAANDIEFTCSNARTLVGVGNRNGVWGEQSAACLTGICGIETRVRPDAGVLFDNTALNDVRFTCC